MIRKIVVTGGCGYIGSHVARAFKFNGDEVFIIDRVKREHTLKDMDGFYISDFADDDALATIFDIAPDVIVHCAGTSLVVNDHRSFPCVLKLFGQGPGHDIYQRARNEGDNEFDGFARVGVGCL